ncbi:dihydroorotate dehydrogenase electron transfer subunit [Candidatus Woesearchaeota archaeon]|nr:dihydroorotate dehydrogenase electron transfer subunit [Candidatus Woesearchaeota archaeon]
MQLSNKPETEICRTDIPQMLEISDVVQEGKSQKSFFFRRPMECRPGQFIMVWLPGVDEKPMAVSYWRKNEFAFTSQAIGRFTNALDNLKKNDKLGIRGPYGNSFSLKDDACVVAGGIGISSVSTLIGKLKNPLVIYGARSRQHLIYLKRFSGKNMILATDDGSYGRKGFTTGILDEALSSNSKIKVVYTCGPEIMMKKVFDICKLHDIECEASVERMMKCSFGICGACMVNDRIVCADGPVFNASQLSKLSEFGRFARIKTGRKVTLKEYHGLHR